ncbi:hypothetical protein LZ31DRAFT_149630 [Colletotrichum somersetense]|nr:hypothetical protein LZ31DRAFT_149630 [Colletotrichum somersetense]
MRHLALRVPRHVSMPKLLLIPYDTNNPHELSTQGVYWLWYGNWPDIECRTKGCTVYSSHTKLDAWSQCQIEMAGRVRRSGRKIKLFGGVRPMMLKIRNDCGRLASKRHTATRLCSRSCVRGNPILAHCRPPPSPRPVSSQSRQSYPTLGWSVLEHFLSRLPSSL